ncbi:MAG: AMP-dependent synthetase [Spirochaetes bacterium GWB1_59_5]|nr:MAG: AMP-dependent synthetase [Spirochaetes bacterium GWB1_59_5]
MAETLALMFMERVRARPDLVMQYSKDEKNVFQATTYGQLLEEVAVFSAGLAQLGLSRGERIGLIADNRKEWLISDLAILGLGAADVPRGCDATEQELSYILSWSECAITILENEKQLAKIIARKTEMPLLKTVVLFDAASAKLTTEANAAGIEIKSFADVFAAGQKRRAKTPGEYETEAAKGKSSDVATIIYTSGTTGEPKGVMLSHANFLHQTEVLPEIIDLQPGQIWLSVLPVWHSFERIVQYAIIAVYDSIAYSKPIGAIMLPDFQAIKPQWMASVPRIWESVKDGIYKNIRQTGGAKKVLFGFFVAVGESYAYFRNMMLGLLPDFGNRSRILDLLMPIIPLILLAPLRGLGELLVFKKIKLKLGGRFKAGVSGGGAMPASVDIFFNTIGVQILEGYGLTETAPVIGLRPQRKPVMGTVGPAIRGTEFKILDEAGKDLGTCKKGIVYVKGPQVMLGYYKKPELTAKVLSSDGWLNTGDLGMLTKKRFLKLTGRAKDTIVLLGGENIEPLPIEQRICDSPYVKQAVVLGQDQHFLAAIIVPDQDMIMAWAKDNNIPIVDYETLLAQPEVKELIDYEIGQAVNAKTGFKSFERIFRFELLATPFEVGKELSAKQEVKRHVVAELYKHRIAKMFKN